jgi:PilZ domain-containing protein
MKACAPQADDHCAMSMHSVDDLRSLSAPVVVDEQALRDAQARLALAVAALDGAAEALIEAGLPVSECEPIDGARERVDEMQRALFARLKAMAATIRRSAAIADLVEADRVAAAPHPVSAGPPDADGVLELLFGESGIGDLETDTGRRLTAVLEYRTGGLITVSTDAGLAAEGATLVGSVVDGAGTPWRIDLVVVSQRERGDRAHLALRPANVDRLERHAPFQLDIGGSATLEAMECGGLYEGTEVLGRVVGLSAIGVAFATLKPLRTGDRLRFHGRFFSEEVRAVVRVMSVDAESEGGGLLVGCWFEVIEPGDRDSVDRVLDHALHPEAPISYSQLRLLSDGKPEPRRGMRRLLRR